MLKAELAGLDDGHHRRISPSSLAGNPFKCENQTENQKGKEVRKSTLKGRP